MSMIKNTDVPSALVIVEQPNTLAFYGCGRSFSVLLLAGQ